jgi:N-acetyl-gamma-glutamyl-phosphate reductase
LVLLSALDNLVKGSGGQGVQCLNLMQGWDETLGLWEAPLIP